MNIQKKDGYNTNSFISIIKYVSLVLLVSAICQIFAEKVLSRYELFLTANYDELLANLFTAQVTIIILPLSLFGVFTEITNEVYLGQPIAEYMYMYKGDHFGAFRYKELVISSMILTLAEYVWMSKGLLTAELITLILNTTAMLVSVFSWIEVRIRKEELHVFIQKQLYTKIESCTKPGLGKTYEKKAILIKLLSKLKDWVVNGGDYELVEFMQFYKNLYSRMGFWDMMLFVQNKEEKEPVNELLSSYKNTDTYFNELVVDLLRKQEYYRALRCSKGMLEIIAEYRVQNYYHPTHYHYRILIELFRKMSETEIELLGDRWFGDYLIAVLKNGNEKGYPILNVQTEEMVDPEKLECIIKEGYILVYEFLMSLWQNDNLKTEYKQKEMERFIFEGCWNSNIRKPILCVSMKLMGTKEQKIIDMVVERYWSQLELFSYTSSPTNEQEFFEKSMVLILAYGYYLAVYTNQNITIPQLKRYIENKEIGIIKECYVWEVLADCVWRWFDKINEFLDRNHELDKDFWGKYYNVIYDIMLYSAMSNKQSPISANDNTDSCNKVIRYFGYITGDNNYLEAAISRYKKFVELFGVRGKITNQIINDQFYEFKKVILQYNIDLAKKTIEGFDKETFWKDLKEKVWEELMADQRFVINSSNEQVSNEDTVYEVPYVSLYLIAPNRNYDAHEIKEFLCMMLFRRNADKEEPCSQEMFRTYDVLSLEWRDEKLNDKEIESLIKKEQGFKVRLNIHQAWMNNIFDMNFRTYEEAYEFVKSEYRKIVFQMKVRI